LNLCDTHRIQRTGSHTREIAKSKIKTFLLLCDTEWQKMITNDTQNQMKTIKKSKDNQESNKGYFMETNNTVKRMRTINECLRMIQAEDPQSPITYFLLKNLCLDGKVKHIITGNKIFINFDDLLTVIF